MLRDSFDFNKLVFSLYKYGAKMIKIQKLNKQKKHAKSLDIVPGSYLKFLPTKSSLSELIVNI